MTYRLGQLCGAILAVVGLSSAAFAQAGAPVQDEEASQRIEGAARAIDRFMAEREPVYDWTLQETTTQNGLTMYQLLLTSQQWHGITWRHSLTVYEPDDVRIEGQVLLFVSGGDNLEKPDMGEHVMAISLANLCGGRVALLKQVPNQPLLGGKEEDDLITETWLRYLESGDESWPLLFPMVKSARQAMDAVTELGEQQGWKRPVETFVITGASKRGWTSWLTPVVDDRVVATAPVVINTLNFHKQMDYQMEVWGEFSRQIIDYTSKGLVTAGDEPPTPREEALLTMMDPWTYRRRLKLPKLIVNGTNDRYWVVDAAKNYYYGLHGPKNILAIPNADHSLEGGRAKAIAGIAALFRATARGERLPNLTWEYTGQETERFLKITCEDPVQGARLWTTTAPTNDFRQAHWSSRPISGEEGHFMIPIPDLGDPQTRQAVFAELEFVDEAISPRLTYSLTTIVKTYLPEE